MSPRLAAAAAAIVVALTACGGGDDPVGDVTMTDAHRFQPADYTVAAGETIVFENTNAEAHTVTLYEDSFPEGAEYFASGGADSEQEAREAVSEGLLSEGDTFEVTLDVPGTYEYFCIPHEDHGMKGTITVES